MVGTVFGGTVLTGTVIPELQVTGTVPSWLVLTGITRLYPEDMFILGGLNGH